VLGLAVPAVAGAVIHLAGGIDPDLPRAATGLGVVRGLDEDVVGTFNQRLILSLNRTNDCRERNDEG
jgi:hypothetical protein